MFEKVYVVPVSSSFLFPFPTETSCYVLFPAMQFVDCILIGARRRWSEEKNPRPLIIVTHDELLQNFPENYRYLEWIDSARTLK